MPFTATLWLWDSILSRILRKTHSDWRSTMLQRVGSLNRRVTRSDETCHVTRVSPSDRGNAQNARQQITLVQENEQVTNADRIPTTPTRYTNVVSDSSQTAMDNHPQVHTYQSSRGNVAPRWATIRPRRCEGLGGFIFRGVQPFGTVPSAPTVGNHAKKDVLHKEFRPLVHPYPRKGTRAGPISSK